MSPKQRALAANISKFIAVIEATGANYHIGITTSDVGTETAPGIPWGGSLSGACESYEGDDGMLQNIPCTDRSNGSADARNACMTLCPDPRNVPLDGRGYILNNYGVTNVRRDLQLDPMTGKMVDRGPSNAFKCMALVGDGGCGIEAPLEGAKRALEVDVDGHRKSNVGFLRPNSTLAVIYLTDEDDCSVQITRRSENDPNTLDCPAGDQNASFKCYNVDYRCIATDVQCDEPMNVPGKKTNCKERSNSRLEAVDKYFKFLSTLRPNPAKLFIGGIWALPSLDTPAGNLTVAKTSGGTTTAFLNRAAGADAACNYKGDTNIVGQAQHRLSRFARQFKDLAGNPNSLEVSICDIDHYGDALEQMGRRIASKQANCLSGLPTLRSNGSPTCVVGYVDELQQHAAPDVGFPVCTPNCCKAWANAAQPSTKDLGIQNACKGDVTEACYCAVQSQKPGVCTDNTAVAGVWLKNNAPPPPGKVVNFKCAVSN
ncbi:MAG: hypothetical protein JNM83_17345 [Myxococcales bacterium]|nr:hypothetical protein [Myxococcales bacterium]